VETDNLPLDLKPLFEPRYLSPAEALGWVFFVVFLFALYTWGVVQLTDGTYDAVDDSYCTWEVALDGTVHSSVLHVKAILNDGSTEWLTLSVDCQRF
jgi:hypothetical protein